MDDEPIGLHRCPNCRMLFSTPQLLQKHLDKFCTSNQSRADTLSASVGRSANPFDNGIQPFEFGPSNNEVEKQSTRLLRELAEYRQRSQEQRKADDELDKFRAGRLFGMMPVPVADRMMSTNDAMLLGVPVGPVGPVGTFRRKVRTVVASASGVDEAHMHLERGPPADVKVVVKRSPVGIESLRRSVTRERMALDMAMKMEQLRAHMADLQLHGGLDPLTDFLLEINELRQVYLQNGGNDPEILGQLTQMQTETQALRRQQVQVSIRETIRAATDREEAAEIAHLQRQNAELEAQLAATRSLSQQAAPVVPIATIAPLPTHPYYYPPPVENTLAQRMQALLQPNVALMPVSVPGPAANFYEDNLQQELMALRAEVNGLRQARAVQSAPLAGRSQSPLASMQAQVQPVAVAQIAGNGVGTGVVIFFDFVSGLDVRTNAVRLVVATFSGTRETSNPHLLPTVKCVVESHGSGLALFNSRQAIEPLLPRLDAHVVVELQLGFEGHLETRAWLRIRLFDLTKSLLLGRFRASFRNTPTKPTMRDEDYDKLGVFGATELFYRVVRGGESDSEMLVENALPRFAHTYMVPPGPGNVLEAALPLPHERVRLISNGLLPKETSVDSSGERKGPIAPVQVGPGIVVGTRVDPPPGMNYATALKRVGIRVCFVKHAEPGLAKVRVGVYEAAVARIAQAGMSPMSAGTSATFHTFKHSYHVFGQEEALFEAPQLRYDDLVIFRLYIRRESPRSSSRRGTEPQDLYIKRYDDDPEATIQFGEEDLVAWTCMPLLTPLIPDAFPLSSRKQYSSAEQAFMLDNMAVLTGLRTLPLFKPPVVDTTQVPFGQFYERPLKYPRYGKGKIRFRIMAEEYFLPDNMSSSTRMSQLQLEHELARDAVWIPYKRKEAPKTPFYASDGFDVYIDGCRHLPEGVTVTRVVAALFTRKWERFGPLLHATQQLDSDIHNPQYDHRQEFRDPAMSPSLTLLLTLVTIERFTRKPKIVGYASLNIFCQVGTELQPEADLNLIQVALNEGGHQLRIYPDGPNRGMVFNNAWMVREKVRPFPAATLLVRLVRAVTGPYGQALSTAEVPPSEWLRVGLIQPKPQYRERAYYSSSCEPWKGEQAILVAQARRPPILAVDMCNMLSDKPLPSLEVTRDYLMYTLLPKMDSSLGRLPEWNTSFVATYQPEFGFSLMLDVVYNVPWGNFTLAYACLNPPAAFFMGPPYQNYDPIVFFTKLDWRNSTNKTAFFRDPYKHFRFRSYAKHLCAIIQLHELGINTAGETLQIQLQDQAWCAVPLFVESFACTESVQVPIFAGKPTLAQLELLSQVSCDDFMQEMRQSGKIRLIEKAFAVVRVSDARRMDETLVSDEYNSLRLNTNFIPLDVRSQYAQTLVGTSLLDMVPTYMTAEEFEKSLVERFKEMVHLLYEAAPRINIPNAPQALKTPSSTSLR